MQKKCKKIAKNAVFFYSFQIKGRLIFAYLKNFLYLCRGFEHGLMEIARTEHLHSAGQRQCTKLLAGHGRRNTAWNRTPLR